MACDSPYIVRLEDGTSVPVPCGRCGVCRKNRVDSWVFRMKQEQKVSLSAYFVTLTYAKCPVSDNNFMTLDPDDLRKYWKRLRKWMREDGVYQRTVRYYAVGEYGDQFGRPHYHMIVFNATVKHLAEAWSKKRQECPIVRTTPKGCPVFGSGKGEVSVEPVSNRTIAYTLKYLDKGRKVPLHDRDDRVREFSRCSKHLGKSYLTPEMKAWHKADLSRNYCQDGQKKVALPRYYRDKIFTGDELLEMRALAEEAKLVTSDKEAKLFFELYPNATESDLALHREYAKEIRFKKYNHGKRKF